MTSKKCWSGGNWNHRGQSLSVNCQNDLQFDMNWDKWYITGTLLWVEIISGVALVFWAPSFSSFEPYVLGKGQLISKCPFVVFKSTKKTNEIFLRIFAIASKKRSNLKKNLIKYLLNNSKKIKCLYVLWFNLFLEARAEIL